MDGNELPDGPGHVQSPGHVLRHLRHDVRRSLPEAGQEGLWGHCAPPKEKQRGRSEKCPSTVENATAGMQRWGPP